MMSKFKTVFLYFLLFVAAAVSSLLGWGLQYPNLITPRANYHLLEGIHGDRWMEDGARVSLPHLFDRGNVLNVKFHSWHPANQASPHVSVSVCGKEVSAFTIEAPFEYPIYLTGSCQPREVTFMFRQTFQAAPDDSRVVAAQLKTLSVSSRAGFPIIDLHLLLISTLALSFTLLLVVALTSSFGRYLSVSAVLALAVYLLANSDFFVFDKLIAAWLVFSGVLIGALFQRLSKEQLPGVSVRITPVFLFLILAIGAGLRVTGLSFGIPNIYHPDEYQKYLAVVRMGSYGDLNPRYFLHPSLLLYSTYAMNALVQAVSDWPTWDASIIFAGRLVSCIAGCFSIALVYYIGSRFSGKACGLIAAAFLAVFPLHVTCSRYVKEDALLTFFVLCAVAFVAKAYRSQSHRMLLLAGVCCGFAASVKYSGLISFFVLWGYPWLLSRRFVPDWQALRWTVLATALLPIGFLIGTPYSVLDYPTFLEDFASERDHMIEGHSSAITAGSQFWMFHIKQSLLQGIGPLALATVVMAAGFVLRRFHILGLYLLALILLFYLPAEFVRAKPAPQPERYVLPCLPFIGLLLGYFWAQLRIVSRVHIIVTLVLFVAWAMPAVRSTQLASEVQVDTRDRMADWIAENLPADASLLVDWKQYGPQYQEPPLAIEYLHPTKIILSIHPEALATNPHDYLILSSLHYSRYFTQPNIVPAFREAIRKVFREYPVVHYETSRFGQYGFHNPDIVLFDLRGHKQHAEADEQKGQVTEPGTETEAASTGS